MDILNKTEQDLVTQFYANEPMREAVKKVLLEALYTYGTLKEGEPSNDNLKNHAFFFQLKNPTATNEEIGANLRAIFQGMIALESGFEQMSEYSATPRKILTINKAR